MRGFSDLPKKETFLDLIYCSSPLEIRTSLDRTSTLVLEVVEVCVLEFVLLLQSVRCLILIVNVPALLTVPLLGLPMNLLKVNVRVADSNGLVTVFLTVLVTTLVVLLVVFLTDGGI